MTAGRWKSIVMVNVVRGSGADLCGVSACDSEQVPEISWIYGDIENRIHAYISQSATCLTTGKQSHEASTFFISMHSREWDDGGDLNPATFVVIATTW